MSLFSLPARKHTAYYDHLMGMAATPTPAREHETAQKATGTSKNDTRSTDSSSDDSRSSVDASKPMNRTYVVPAPSQSSGSATPTRGRLTLQKRKTGADKTMTENTQITTSATPAAEKRLALQRRTGSVDRIGASDLGRGAQGPRRVNVSKDPHHSKGLFRSASARDASTSKGKVHQFTAPVNTPGKGVAMPESRTPSLTNGRSLAVPKNMEDKAKGFSTPNRQTTFEKVSAKKDMFEKLAKNEVPKGRP